MIGMRVIRVGSHDQPRPVLAQTGDDRALLPVVMAVEAEVRQAQGPPPGHAQLARRGGGLGGALLDATARAPLTPRQVRDPDRMTVRGQQRRETTRGEFHVVRVSTEEQGIQHGHNSTTRCSLTPRASARTCSAARSHNAGTTARPRWATTSSDASRRSCSRPPGIR